MAHSADDYTAVLRHLLPRGFIWSAEKGGTLYRLLAAFAQELARIEGDAGRLLNELNPSTTLEALPDWEKELGLPDSCITSDQSLAARREAVILRLQRGGLAAPRTLRAIARRLGYPEAEVFSVRPFHAGHSFAGEALWDETKPHVFYVSVPTSRVTRLFHAGQAQAGQHLSYAGDPVLECIIRREKPAHTEVVFQFSADREGA